jgi:Family of unknown function (DUF6459)
MTNTATAPAQTSAIAPAPPAGWAGTGTDEPGPSAYTQGALALTYPLPSGLDSVPHSRALAVVTSVPGEPGDENAPQADGWAARFVQAVLEVLTGDRPITQLIRWTDEDVYDELSRRLDVLQARRRGVPVRSGRHQVATVHVWQVSEGRAEVAARVTNGRRSRAVAARLDLHRGRWVCTAIQFE